MRKRTLLAVIPLALVAAPAGAASALPNEAASNAAVRDVGTAIGSYIDEVRLEESIAALQADVATYVQSVIAQEYAARQAAMAARRPRASGNVPAPTRSAQPAGDGGACGGATNGADQFISRESHGEPYVWNTEGSGAWGCYQIMPATWASSCGPNSPLGDVGGAHGSATPDQQAECASRLPLSAWGG